MQIRVEPPIRPVFEPSGLDSELFGVDVAVRGCRYVYAMVEPDVDASEPRRLIVIAASAFTSLALVLGLFGPFLGHFVERGAAAYEIRALQAKNFERRYPDRPLVAWFGDSTTISYGFVPSYPQALGLRNFGAVRIEVLNSSGLGYDQFIHYTQMGRALAHDPAAIFIVANVRILGSLRRERGVVQLASSIPWSEVPHALQLPWHVRGVSLPRLLLARFFDLPFFTEAVYAYEGARREFRAMWNISDPKLAALDVSVVSEMLERYDTPISEDSPAIRMLRASTEMAVRRGVPVTVVVAPVPGPQLRTLGPILEERIEILRSAVATAGGGLIDMSRALTHELFSDRTGHYNARGVEIMADRLAPLVFFKVREGQKAKGN